MARQRQQVESGIRPGSLRPSASPVDTFAPSQAGQQLAQLANGLKEFAPSLSRFSDTLYEKESKDAAEAGAAQARQLQEARVSLRDAVAKGMIPAHRNPFFLVGLKEQYGRISAGTYAEDLKVAMAADEQLQKSTDLGDFDTFESDFRKKWMESNVGDNRDQHFERGFGNLVDGYTLDAKRQFGAQVGARIQKQAGQQVYTEALQILRDHNQETPELRSQMIEQMTKGFLKDNPKGGRQANLAVIQAVTDFAELTGDESALDLLDKIGAGPGGKIGGLPEATAARLDAQRNIWRDKEAKLGLEHAQETDLQKKAEESVWSGLSQAVDQSVQDGSLATFDATEWVKRMRAVDPERADELVHNYIKNRREGQTNDGAYFNGALLRVYGLDPDRPNQFLSMRDAGRALSGGLITAPQFQNLVNQMQERDRENAGNDNTSKLLNDRQFTYALHSVTARFIDEYGTNDAGVRNMAMNAQGDFLRRYLAAKQSGQDVSPTALQQMADEVFFDNADEDTEEAFFAARGLPAPNANLTSSTYKQYLGGGESSSPAPKQEKKKEIRLYGESDWKEIKTDAMSWLQNSQHVKMTPKLKQALFAARVVPTKAGIAKWLEEQNALPSPGQ